MMLRALLCHCCPVPPPQPVHMYCGIPSRLYHRQYPSAQRSLSGNARGVVFLDESLTVRTIFSALAVLTGIVMVTREKSPRQSMTKAREPITQLIHAVVMILLC
jgi:hypothetical protein